VLDQRAQLLLAAVGTDLVVRVAAFG